MPSVAHVSLRWATAALRDRPRSSANSGSCRVPLPCPLGRADALRARRNAQQLLALHEEVAEVHERPGDQERKRLTWTRTRRAGADDQARLPAVERFEDECP